MPVSRCRNRITVFLVALCYVFLSTFAAVSHTHAYLEAEFPGAQGHAAASKRTSISGETRQAQAHCVACEWQALSVTMLVRSNVCDVSRLERLLPVLRSFTYHASFSALFACRAPPAL